MALKGMLDYRSVELTDHGPAGGTNGARIALDPSGTRWLVKHYRGNPDRVATELLANAVYRELEIRVPEAGTALWSSPDSREWTAVTYPMIDGELRTWGQPNAQLAEGFVADALLANWDVVGQTQDNILWQGLVPIRLDQGGALEFRARGARKPYGPTPIELKSMLGSEGQAQFHMAVTLDLILRTAGQVAAALTGPRVVALVSGAPFGDEPMRNRIQRNLQARLAWLERLGGSQRDQGLKMIATLPGKGVEL